MLVYWRRGGFTKADQAAAEVLGPLIARHLTAINRITINRSSSDSLQRQLSVCKAELADMTELYERDQAELLELRRQLEAQQQEHAQQQQKSNTFRDWCVGMERLAQPA